jgi:hypothetical protein
MIMISWVTLFSYPAKACKSRTGLDVWTLAPTSGNVGWGRGGGAYCRNNSETPKLTCKGLGYRFTLTDVVAYQGRLRVTLF